MAPDSRRCRLHTGVWRSSARGLLPHGSRFVFRFSRLDMAPGSGGKNREPTTHLASILRTADHAAGDPLTPLNGLEGVTGAVCGPRRGGLAPGLDLGDVEHLPS